MVENGKLYNRIYKERNGKMASSNLKDNLEKLQIVAKERTVKTQNIEYDLETLVKKIKKGIIKLNPDYQRNHRWNDSESSRLMESLILNIPIPTVYLSQDVDVDEEVDDDVARYSVIDGQQRLKASVIEKYFEEIVGRNFWGYITDCRIEKVFENDNEFVLEITTQLSDILTRGVREFPYNIDISSIELNLSNNKVSDDCLWKTFLNQTLKARHNVAHGISFDNTMSIEEIKNTREKIVILEKLFAVLIFKYGIK